MTFQKLVRNLAVVAVCAMAFALLSSPSYAVTIFQEDWNSYTGFPGSSNDTGGHRTNFGVPTIAEGADNDWIGARFEYADDDPIDDDIGVLKSAASAPFNTPAGRVSDDAGLVAQIDLTGYFGAELSFDWRTFATETSDRLVVAYYIGDDLGTPGNVYDWFNDPNLGNGDLSATDPQGQANTWYQNNWIEVFRDRDDNPPAGMASEVNIPLTGTNNKKIYVAFWLDNGDHDLGKIDNIVITAELIPEPTSAVYLLVAICGLGLRRSRA